MIKSVSSRSKFDSLGAWFIWLIAALFYSYEFFQRVMPGVISKQLMAAFSLNATTLGTIDSLYFYAYAVSQLVAGLILDKFGVKICTTLACLVVAVGTYLFSQSNSLAILAFARIIVGVGSAFAFVGCLKLASNWFHSKRFALVVGLTNMLGTIGALFGELPLSNLVGLLGWQQSLVASSLLGVLLAICMMLFVRDCPAEADCHPNSYGFKFERANIFKYLIDILKSKQAWWIALYAGLMVAPVIAFAELWAVPFLQISHHLTRSLAAEDNSLIFIGIAVGAPLNGLISGWLKKRKLIMFIGNTVALICLIAIVFATGMPGWLLDITLFIFGYFTSSMLLCFAINTEVHDHRMNGTVIAFTNMLITIIGALFQPLIGHVIDLFATTSHHHSTYSTHSYQLAILSLIMALAINLLILKKIKEPKPQVFKTS